MCPQTALTSMFPWSPPPPRFHCYILWLVHVHYLYGDRWLDILRLMALLCFLMKCTGNEGKLQLYVEIGQL